jgi:tRNA (adenine57-N1/adenine58-N1)-methyltransferase
MIQAGDRVLLYCIEKEEKHILRVDKNDPVKGLGNFSAHTLEGMQWGDRVEASDKQYVVLKPTLRDAHETIRRKAQLITPKDASRIFYELSLNEGDRVLESGIGSGGTTLGLLHAVGPTGEVVAQELRNDFADFASKNVRRAGLIDQLTVKIGDLTKGLAEGVVGPFQGVLLDQPEPWLAMPHIEPVLEIGARVVAYCPQISQVEQTVRAMKQWEFEDIQCMELMERLWDVDGRICRPSSEGIGHTAFLVIGRYVGM